MDDDVMQKRRFIRDDLHTKTENLKSRTHRARSICENSEATIKLVKISFLGKLFVTNFIETMISQANAKNFTSTGKELAVQQSQDDDRQAERSAPFANLTS